MGSFGSIDSIDHVVNNAGAFFAKPFYSREKPRRVLMLTLEDARRVIEAAEKKAQDMDCPSSIAIVDEGGNLASQVRVDGGGSGGQGQVGPRRVPRHLCKEEGIQ
jgi:Haem-degrading